MTGMGVVSIEAVEESKKVLAGRNFYIRTDGTIAHSVNTDTVKYLMAGMTGKPIEPVKPIEVKVKISKEELREDLEGHDGFFEPPSPYEQEGDPTFKFLGDVHDLNMTWRLLAGMNAQPEQIRLVSLNRHLTGRFDFNEADKADLNKPMLVAKIHDGYFLLDGIQQLRSYTLGKAMVGKAIVVPPEILKETFIKNTDGDHEYR